VERSSSSRGNVARRLIPLAVAAGVMLATPPISRPAPREVAARTVTEPIAPLPPGPMLDPDRVALGERLFRDPRLSGGNRRSCAACHPLGRAGMDAQPRAIAADGKTQLRNTPTVFNVAFEFFLNWDGAAETLEQHAALVVLNPDLMNTTWPEVLAKLHADGAYAAAFRGAYADGLTERNVLDALATFQRSLRTPDAPFDRYLRGDERALTTAEARGYQLFKSYGCVTCHQGVNVGGNMFQRFGVFPAAAVPRGASEAQRYTEPDAGRFRVTGAPRDRGVFRVPSLRNVAVTAPYFHDGRAATLESAVDTMAKVQLGRTLKADEIDLIVQFLRTLTGRYRGAPLASPGATMRDR
jgi:cytochrome c peroxidase